MIVPLLRIKQASDMNYDNLDLTFDVMWVSQSGSSTGSGGVRRKLDIPSQPKKWKPSMGLSTTQIISTKSEGEKHV